MKNTLLARMASSGSTESVSKSAKTTATGRPSRLSDTSQGPGLLEMVAGDDPDDERDKLAARSSSIIGFYPDWCRCFERAYHGQPLDADATYFEQIKEYFSCPPRGRFAKLLLMIAFCILLWAFLLFLFQPTEGKHRDIDLNPAWFHGAIFGLFVIEVTGLSLGIILKRYMNLPALLGPLVLGILYRNVDSINVFALMNRTENCTVESAGEPVDNYVKPIRVIALAVILTRAGLELSPKQLRKLKGVVPLLAFTPCLVEACTCALFSYIFFNITEENEDHKLSLAMCFVGGFALGAVSPAVVVPGALSLKKGGYGVMKGVPTLLIAASSIDDVLAISIYTIALGFAITHAKDPPWQTYTGGIIGITIGLIHGVIVGMILHFLPARNSRNKADHRLIFLLLLNFVSLFAYDETFFNAAGSVSVLVTSFIAGFGWRSQPHWKRPMRRIDKALAHLWVLWVPLIFGTIGKEINFRSATLQGSLVGKIFAVILICLVVRCITAFFVVSCVGFNLKERIFIALSWIPKATVQAALAPLVITRAAESEDGKAKYSAHIVVNIAILAVLITAPLGCILMALTGPKLLQQNSGGDINMQVEEEFPNGEGLDPNESVFQELAEQVEQIRLKKGSSNERLNDEELMITNSLRRIQTLSESPGEKKADQK